MEGIKSFVRLCPEIAPIPSHKSQHQLVVQSSGKGVFESNHKHHPTIPLSPNNKQTGDDPRDLMHKSCLQVHQDQNYIKVLKCGTYSSDSTPALYFDKICEADVSQEEFYEDNISKYVEEAVVGYNVTILTWGAARSGKSYTMIGDVPKTAPSTNFNCSATVINGARIEPNSRRIIGSETLALTDICDEQHNLGIIPRALRDVFTSVDFIHQEDSSITYHIELSFVELYNNTFTDLLETSRNFEARQQSKLRRRSLSRCGSKTDLRSVSVESRSHSVSHRDERIARDNNNNNVSNNNSSRTPDRRRSNSHSQLYIQAQSEYDDCGNQSAIEDYSYYTDLERQEQHPTLEVQSSSQLLYSTPLVGSHKRRSTTGAERQVLDQGLQTPPPNTGDSLGDLAYRTANSRCGSNLVHSPPGTGTTTTPTPLKEAVRVSTAPHSSASPSASFTRLRRSPSPATSSARNKGSTSPSIITAGARGGGGGGGVGEATTPLRLRNAGGGSTVIGPNHDDDAADGPLSTTAKRSDRGSSSRATSPSILRNHTLGGNAGLYDGSGFTTSYGSSHIEIHESKNLGVFLTKPAPASLAASLGESVGGGGGNNNAGTDAMNTDSDSFSLRVPVRSVEQALELFLGAVRHRQTRLTDDGHYSSR